MRRAIIAPGCYVQDRGAMGNLATYCEELSARRVLCVTGPHVRALYEKKIASSFETAGIFLRIETYCGECTDDEIERLSTLSQEMGSQAIIAVGGGKPIDTGKAVAAQCGVPVIVVPTSASSDAPCSKMSVVYTTEGRVDHPILFAKSPDYVVMDLDVLAQAPVRFLAAGMGDALATYYEALACQRSFAVTVAGGVASPTALALCRLCRDTLLADGVAAYEANKRGEVTEAFENVVEANTYLSGVGFENGGVAAAHAFQNGLGELEQTLGFYHGEKVAWGVLCQLMLEKIASEELGVPYAHSAGEYDAAKSLFRSVGLPVCLDDLGIANCSDGDLMNVATRACDSNDTMSFMPFETTPELLLRAMKMVG